MSEYKYKLVDGELVELTAEEIAQFERDAQAEQPPPPQPEPPQ